MSMVLEPTGTVISIKTLPFSSVVPLPTNSPATVTFTVPFTIGSPVILSTTVTLIVVLPRVLLTIGSL